MKYIITINSDLNNNANDIIINTSWYNYILNNKDFECFFIYSNPNLESEYKIYYDYKNRKILEVRCKKEFNSQSVKIYHMIESLLDKYDFEYLVKIDSSIINNENKIYENKFNNNIDNFIKNKEFIHKDYYGLFPQKTNIKKTVEWLKEQCKNKDYSYNKDYLQTIFFDEEIKYYSNLAYTLSYDSCLKVKSNIEKAYDFSKNLLGIDDLFVSLSIQKYEIKQNPDIIEKKKILIVLDKYNDGILKDSNILKNELNCEVIEFNELIKNNIHHDIILWQNVFKEIPPKKKCQKYIYIVHDQCDVLNDIEKESIFKNNNYIDIYVFISNSVKENFEQNFLIPENSFIIENNMINDIDFKIFSAKFKDLCNIDHEFNSKICIVSSITNNYDKFNVFDTNNLKCYLYSDTYINFKNKNFKCITFNKSFFNSIFSGLYKNDKRYLKSTNDMMIAKYFKIKHHILPEIKNFEYTIWIDGRTKIINSILLKFKIYELFINNDTQIAAHHHSRWNTITQDTLYCKNFMNDFNYLKVRYDSQDLINQLLNYYNLGYLDNNQYMECGFIIRDNKNPKSILFFDNWWNENIKKTYQDQLSFKYLINKYNINIKFIGNNIYDNEYSHIGQHAHQNSNNNILSKFNTNLKNVNSFDFFDTLCGRICFSNYEIFNLIEKRLNITNFAENRINSEKIICQNTNNCFFIEDVYKHLYENIETKLTIDELINYEYLLELDLLFLIHENVNKLNEKSIIVSDFFYDKNRFTNMIYIKKIWIHSSNIFVTNAGKLNGDIWEKINFNVISHIGDNEWSDINNPIYKKLNIKTNYFNKMPNEYENFMIDNNYKFLGYIMRSIRMSNPYLINSDKWILWNFYSNHYLPILFLKIFSLKLLYDLKNTKIVFMSRDGYFLLHIYRAIFPNYKYDYIYISRNAMKNSSKKYIDYIRKKVKDSVVVDLLGTGKSFYNFTKKNKIKFKYYHLCFMGRNKNDIIEYFPDMKMYAVFNYFNRYIERLNYSCHGSFIKFCDGKIITKKKEYDDDLYEPVYKIINIFSKHIFKINDIINLYNFDEKNLYKLMYYYLGPPDFIHLKCESFTKIERDILDKIDHECDHKGDEDLINTDIDYDYFLDLDEYLNLK